MKKNIFELTNNAPKLTTEDLHEDLSKPVKRKSKTDNKTLHISEEGFFGFFRKKKMENFDPKEFLDSLKGVEKVDLSLPIYFKDVKHLVKYLDTLIHKAYPFLFDDMKRLKHGLDFIRSKGKDIIHPEHVQQLYNIVKIDTSKLDEYGRLRISEDMDVSYFNFWKKEPTINQLMGTLYNEKDVDNIEEMFELEREEAHNATPFYTLAEIVPVTDTFLTRLGDKRRRKVSISSKEHEFNQLIDKLKKIIELSDKASEIEHLQNEAIKLDKFLQPKDFGDGDEYGLYASLFMRGSSLVAYNLERGVLEDIRELFI